MLAVKPSFGGRWLSPAFLPAQNMEREMPQGDIEETKASALLPNLKIEILHGRLPTGDAERLTISVLAVPSFDAIWKPQILFCSGCVSHRRHGRPGLALFRHQRREAPLAGFPRQRKLWRLHPPQSATAKAILMPSDEAR
jgi:hypothetical protein